MNIIQSHSRIGAGVLDAQALSERLAATLATRHRTLATAESCTGGLVGVYITAVPGSSAYFLGGMVAYANEAKVALLGVRPETLAQFGAVSAETACEMAAGARTRLGADIAVSVTGIAGPDGGTAAKPVGLVYIGLAAAGGVAAHRFVFAGDRAAVREAAVAAALTLVLEALGTENATGSVPSDA